MATACYRCGKQIKGRAVHVVPSRPDTAITGIGPTSYHRECFIRRELETARELNMDPMPTRAEIIASIR